MTTRRALLVAAGATLVGAVAGAAVAELRSPPYRATTTVLVQVHGAPATLPTVAALATGESVIGNVASAMHVAEGTVRGRLHVRVVPATALIELSYDDSNRVVALQAAQEEASVLQAIVSARLGSVVRTSVADPARASRRGAPLGRDALLGGSLGLLLAALGTSAAAARASAPREPAVKATPPEPQTVAPVAPVAEPVQPPAPSPPPVQGRVAELRALVDAHGAEHSPDQLAEWHGYLEAFATQEVDGALPPNLEGLARDVFAPLLAR